MGNLCASQPQKMHKDTRGADPQYRSEKMKLQNVSNKSNDLSEANPIFHEIQQDNYGPRGTGMETNVSHNSKFLLHMNINLNDDDERFESFINQIYKISRKFTNDYF
jgi:hypothetical protein|tara:strand:+ start:151 stop:471 length:321 start_codon:yes stop_codon:yes gene_type:complete